MEGLTTTLPAFFLAGLVATVWGAKDNIIASAIQSFEAWLELPPEPDPYEQMILDSLDGKRRHPENDMAKYVKALEALVAEQKKTIKAADVIVEQAQLSAKNLADITPQLIREINRLQVANATLSGAYHWVTIMNNDGKKKLVRFSLN